MPDFGSPFSGLELNRKLTREELLRGLRFFVAAEFEAVQLYTQLANACDDPDVQKVVRDISDEELVHAGEFLSLIEKLAPEEEKLYEEGKKETQDLIGKKSYTEVLRGLRAYRAAKELDRIAEELEAQNPLFTLLLDKISDKIEASYGLETKPE